MTTILRRRQLLGSGVLAASLIAAGAATTLVQAEPLSYRSVKDVRSRIPDELDRPYRRETVSHRGWEIREDQFTIVANTSLEDARWAAAEVTAVRGQMATLADRFTRVHRAADFGLNSLAIVIDGDPSRDRDAPATTIQVTGIQTQATINVSTGRPKLRDQLLRLREAAALAMLHTAEVDGTLPPWVTTGLAAHIALQGQPADSPKPDDFPPRGEPLGGEAWRWKRAGQDRLESQPQSISAAAAQVEFLLTGNDAAHASEFLSAISQSLAQGRDQAASGLPMRRRGEGQAVIPPGRFDQLIAANRSSYEAWLKEPLSGQPQFQPEPNASPELLREQRDMLVVLKLERRLAAAKASRTGVKVAAFDRDQGKAIVGPPPNIEPPPIADLVARLRDPSQPALATLDGDGQLLLSTDRERINQLLGWDGQRYQLRRSGDQWTLATRLADGRTLEGSLTDDPQKPGRPLAKFSVVNAGAAATPAPTLSAR